MKKTPSIPVSVDKNVVCLPDANLHVVLACYENDSLELHQTKEKTELAFSAAQMLSFRSAEHKTFLSRSVPFNPFAFLTRYWNETFSLGFERNILFNLTVFSILFPQKRPKRLNASLAQWN